MDSKLLDILVCPVTGAVVQIADTDTLARINAAVSAGTARHADDTPVEDPLTEALVTRDGHTAYPVDDGIPLMLPERGIDLTAIG